MIIICATVLYTIRLDLKLLTCKTDRLIDNPIRLRRHFRESRRWKDLFMCIKLHRFEHNDDFVVIMIS